MTDNEEQMALPKPNYAAEKPEDAFNLDESLLINIDFALIT